ncbi:DUF3549 family protein [sulfur-oxidizing endosymbiont of Gigantopelta aegis]|uniref:DUF3549 family protein n=1 Tax=sulfur-oxidizing endosymbiont of Gigantopelta aegis TaxID=2794934 RepID=UPI0018DE0CEE|nr:DUF3549 family protein [sulfur-oxidizing endosymbiont of Gigantopelta aegis]
MKAMRSFNQFFSEIDCQFQCYNLGRIVSTVEKADFIDFEETRIPWQMPFLQHAWFALLFWKNKAHGENKVDLQANEAQQHVWFIKLPLDEQAKLNLAARDDFLRRLFEVLGNYLTLSQEQKSDNTEDKLNALQKAMQDNPYGFTPKPEQMANFHAMVHKQLNLPTSEFYSSTQNYLAKIADDTKHDNDWQSLGIQGFADICARLDESDTLKYNNEKLINNALSQLPIEPFTALCSCLENYKISHDMSDIIFQRLNTLLSNAPAELNQWCLAITRANAQASVSDKQIKLLQTVLGSAVKADIELLASLAGRSWHAVTQPEILPDFLEALALAESEYPGAFKAIVADLMFIPGLREVILAAFRSPERSPQLSQAIGSFFKTL